MTNITNITSAFLSPCSSSVVVGKVTQNCRACADVTVSHKRHKKRGSDNKTFKSVTDQLNHVAAVEGGKITIMGITKNFRF